MKCQTLSKYLSRKYQGYCISRHYVKCIYAGKGIWAGMCTHVWACLSTKHLANYFIKTVSAGPATCLLLLYTEFANIPIHFWHIMTRKHLKRFFFLLFFFFDIYTFGFQILGNSTEQYWHIMVSLKGKWYLPDRLSKFVWDSNTKALKKQN